MIEIRWNDKQCVHRRALLRSTEANSTRSSPRRPIYSTDFHSVVPAQHLKKAHPYAHEQANEVQDEEKAWRLATCGADNKIRVSSHCTERSGVAVLMPGSVFHEQLWLVHPRPVSGPAETAASLLAAVARSSSAGPDSTAPLASTSTAPPPPLPPSAAAGKTEPKDLDPKVEYLATLSQHQGVVNCVRFSPNGEHSTSRSLRRRGTRALMRSPPIQATRSLQPEMVSLALPSLELPSRASESRSPESRVRYPHQRAQLD